ncbi:hypothetical protein EBT31_17150, partial [bacterium]|nr:hypothetical protein [bacterium]
MKKTNQENPLSFFRKANETRQKNVRASIKKAQDGIEMNDDLINKAGSTGGYKPPVNKWWLETNPNVRISNQAVLDKMLPKNLNAVGVNQQMLEQMQQEQMQQEQMDQMKQKYGSPKSISMSKRMT